MRIDTKSLTYRLIVPVIVAIIAFSLVLILSLNIIANHIIEEFRSHAISNYVVRTMQIIELAQSDLTNANLLDNPPVVEAKKRLTLEAIALSWHNSNVLGLITDEKGAVIFTNLQPEIMPKLPLSRDTGYYYIDLEKNALNMRIVNYHEWGWKLFVAAKTDANGAVRKEVYYLIPLVIIVLILIISAIIIILRRNLQGPVHAMVSAIGSGQVLPATGISELDSISRAMNQTMTGLKARTEELAAELQEREKAEAALRAEKNKTDAIIAAMGDGISIQDRNYKILYQNEVHRSFFGSHQGEYCFRAYDAKDAVCEGCPVALTFNDGRVHTVTRTVHMPAGTKYFEITTSPLRDSEGVIKAGIEVVRDVTELRHNEELLRQAQKMEGIGQLAGGIAHDFNNILTAIIGYATLLKLHIGQNEQLSHYVKHILESSERASGLTKSLLAFSRKQPVYFKPLDLNKLAGEFMNIISRLIGEEITLELKCSIEDLVVEADKGQLEQVLMNFATNARDAMPNGGKISISTECIHMDRDMGDVRKGSYAVLAFSDNGMGIDPKTKEHIFEPFFTTKEVGKGTGLGLAIAYGIINKHGGMIHVYSEPGQGTTFRIYLPIAKTEVLSGDETAAALPRGSETILLVEDNEETRRVTRQLLEEFGYSVIEAVDGEDAVALFRKNQDSIQLVLSDLIMPRKNGKEACEEIKKLCPDIRIIIMSGYTADIIEHKGALQEGMHFISKPLTPSSLLNEIRSVLTK